MSFDVSTEDTLIWVCFDKETPIPSNMHLLFEMEGVNEPVIRVATSYNLPRGCLYFHWKDIPVFAPTQPGEYYKLRGRRLFGPVIDPKSEWVTSNLYTVPEYGHMYTEEVTEGVVVVKQECAPASLYETAVAKARAFNMDPPSAYTWLNNYFGSVPPNTVRSFTRLNTYLWEAKYQVLLTPRTAVIPYYGEHFTGIYSRFARFFQSTGLFYSGPYSFCVNKRTGAMRVTGLTWGTL